MCCTEADLEFKDAGIIVLNGENGSGKSSALDAIAICLCEHKRADKFNDFVQKGFNEATIDMHSTLNNEPLIFHIKMHYSKGAALERDVEYKGKHYINSEATPLLEDLDLPFYSTIIFSMQGDADVASMSPSARATFLQKLLQFDFDKQSQHLKAKIEEFEDKKTYNNNQSEFISTNIKNKSFKEEEPLPLTAEEVTKSISSQKDLQELVKNKDVYYNLKSELANKASNISKSIYEVKTSQSLIETWKSNLAEYEKEKEQLEAEISNERIIDFDTQINELLEKVSKLTKNNEKLGNSKYDIYRDTTTLESKIKELQKREELHAQGKCPVCGQSVDFIAEEHNEEEILNLQKQITDNNVKMSDNESLTQKNNIEIVNLNSQIASLKDSKAQIDAKHNQLKKRLDTVLATLESLKQKKPNISSENLEELEAQLKSCQETSKENDIKLQDINQYEKKLSDVTTLLNHYNEVEVHNTWIAEENKKLEKEIEEGEKQVQQLQKENIDLTNEQGNYTEARKIIDTDLPNFLIVKTCGRLEQEMNNFIQVVFPTMQVRLFQNKKGVEFFYTKDANADATSKAALINTKMASGFEKSLLSIAFKVALCRAYNLSFTVLDEIDAFATDLSSAKIFQSLILSHTFNQIFIITHKPSTREIIQDTSENCIVYHVEKGKFTIEDGE